MEPLKVFRFFQFFLLHARSPVAMGDLKITFPGELVWPGVIFIHYQMTKIINRKNQLKTSLVIDEFTTLTFLGFDTLIATGRSNNLPLHWPSRMPAN